MQGDTSYQMQGANTRYCFAAGLLLKVLSLLFKLDYARIDSASACCGESGGLGSWRSR